MPENKDKNNKHDIFISNSIYPEAESLFKIPKSLEEIKDESYVVLDTNSLLVPYATSKESLNQIQSTYTTLVEQKRLIIPGQVAREFVNNRANKIVELYQQISQKQDYIKLPTSGGKYPLLESLPDYQELIQVGKELKEKADQYRKVVRKLLEHIEGWNWDDPVSKIYSDLFGQGVVIDLELDEQEKEEIENQLDIKNRHKLPPGYKDYSKDDKGIGDLLIWRTILHIGKNNKKSVIFVSGDEKQDWWYRSANKALYPRYELVDEFRRYSEGQAFHIIGLSSLLEMYGADDKVIREVEEKEEQIVKQSFTSIDDLPNSLLVKLAEKAVLIWLRSQFKSVTPVYHNPMNYKFVVEDTDSPVLVNYIIVKTIPNTSVNNTIVSQEIKLTMKKYFNEIRSLMFVFVYLDKFVALRVKKITSEMILPSNFSIVIGYLGEGDSFQKV